MTALQSVDRRLATDRTVNGRDHVILTDERNRAIVSAADVMARHGAKSSRRNLRRGDGASVRFVAMQLRSRTREFGLRHVSIKRSFE